MATQEITHFIFSPRNNGMALKGAKLLEVSDGQSNGARDNESLNVVQNEQYDFPKKKIRNKNRIT
ncbi:hypothetical protein MAR_002920 [Mya arenaria]|uniref:Uncharacterized protein n=1 Tax=Mya arenaria TaxID=6604 RepID=A0ABY7G7P7_MYAAR|nr:hypothetical protein MAR_002920 [Mya arenaria]